MVAQFLFLLQIVAPVFVVMALGYMMRKIGILSSEADRSLTRLVVTLLAPCLAFDTIIGNEGLAMALSRFRFAMLSSIATRWRALCVFPGR